MKKLIFAIVLGIALVATVSWASDVTPNLDKGTKQLRLYGSYDGNTPLDYQFVLGGGFGYFFWDNFELGIVAGWQSNDLADDYELGVVGEYNFNFGSPWVPFIFAGALWTGVELDDSVYNEADEIDDDAWLGRFGGGIKYFFRDSVSLGMSVNYDIASKDIYPDEDGNVDDYNWTALLNLSFYFD